MVKVGVKTGVDVQGINVAVAVAGGGSGVLVGNGVFVGNGVPDGARVLVGKAGVSVTAFLVKLANTVLAAWVMMALTVDAWISVGTAVATTAVVAMLQPARMVMIATIASILNVIRVFFICISLQNKN